MFTVVSFTLHGVGTVFVPHNAARLQYSLTVLVQEALFRSNDRMLLQKMQWSKSYKDDNCPVAVDVSKIKTAILNVIANALEAVEGRSGHVVIADSRQKEYGRIEITYNGPDINESAIGKMFDPYFSRKPHGNGLGLTNAQNILLNHKGSIDLESMQGEGARFILLIPCVD